MIDRYYLATLILGLLIFILANAAENTGLITTPVLGILRIISIGFMVLGLFLSGRTAGRTILKNAKKNLSEKDK